MNPSPLNALPLIYKNKDSLLYNHIVITKLRKPPFDIKLLLSIPFEDSLLSQEPPLEQCFSVSGPSLQEHVRLAVRATISVHLDRILCLSISPSADSSEEHRLVISQYVPELLC